MADGSQKRIDRLSQLEKMEYTEGRPLELLRLHVPPDTSFAVLDPGSGLPIDPQIVFYRRGNTLTRCGAVKTPSGPVRAFQRLTREGSKIASSVQGRLEDAEELLGQDWEEFDDAPVIEVKPFTLIAEDGTTACILVCGADPAKLWTLIARQSDGFSLLGRPWGTRCGGARIALSRVGSVDYVDITMKQCTDAQWSTETSRNGLHSRGLSQLLPGEGKVLKGLLPQTLSLGDPDLLGVQQLGTLVRR